VAALAQKQVLSGLHQQLAESRTSSPKPEHQLEQGLLTEAAVGD
jgi:hypothetical protein